MIWICPNCSSNLNLENKRWACTNGHHFDVAKQGYVNLLSVSRKGSHSPGDSKEMLAARHRFLLSGYYTPLVTELIHLAQHQINDHFIGQWLDLGCGSGYFISQIQNSSLHHQPNWSCLDISKEAVKMTANTTSTNCAVASNFDLPVQSASCNGLLQIFSPAEEKEIFRVLKPNGFLLRITPGPNHLKEIKEAIYTKSSTSKPPPSQPLYQVVTEQTLYYSIQLPNAQIIKDLITMTPFNWRGNPTAKQQLINQGYMKLSLDFRLQLFKKDTQAISRNQQSDQAVQDSLTPLDLTKSLKNC